MKIEPVHYLWKDERMNKGRPKGEIGFIAQNVEKVLPELVGETTQPPDSPIKLPDGKQKALSYDRLIAPAVLAIQQLKELIDQLKVMIDGDHGLLMRLQALVETDHARIAADEAALKISQDEIAKLKAANDNQAKAVSDLREEFRTYKKKHP